jgi:transcriptional regulator of arginine metabolism
MSRPLAVDGVPRHPGSMAKAQRHAVLRELVQTNRVSNQEHLRELLAARGFDVAQATLSRDIRELRLIKIPDADGRTHYTLPPEAWDNTPPLHRLLPTLYVGAEGVGNLLLLKTLSGGAQAVAEALDWEEWPEVLGTVAGDDTILVILRDAAKLATVHHRLEEIVGSVD